MKTYLIRERDHGGQIVHIETLKDVDFEIDDKYLEENYGPGYYSILIAVKGKAGLQHFGDWVITPDFIDSKHFKSKPKDDDVKKAFNTEIGTFYITKQTKAQLWQFTENEGVQTADEMSIFNKAQDALPAISGYMVYQIDESKIKEKRRRGKSST